MRILVTGGAGYIGSILVPALLAEDHHVTVLDNFMYRQASLLDHCADPRLRVIRGDCRDEATLRTAMSGQDALLPLAALVGAPICKDEPEAARSTNLDAVRLLLRLRSREQMVIFPNTNSGYGIGDANEACTEESPLRPLTLYGQTKVDAEHAVMAAGNAVCFRLATVFGMSPRMRVDLLVNDFVFRAVHDRAVVVFEGHFRRNFVHVRDVARAFLHAIERFESMRDQVYNVGLDEANVSKIDLCRRIAEHVPGFAYVEAPIGEDPDKRDYVVSNEKIARTGFGPRHSLDDGIRELIKGYIILPNVRYGNV